MIFDKAIFARLLSCSPISAFNAGHYLGLRNEWMRRARAEVRPEWRTRCVRIAREHHRQMLREVSILPATGAA